jgi:hypothetical protein
MLLFLSTIIGGSAGLFGLIPVFTVAVPVEVLIRYFVYCIAIKHPPHLQED